MFKLNWLKQWSGDHSFQISLCLLLWYLRLPDRNLLLHVTCRATRILKMWVIYLLCLLTYAYHWVARGKHLNPRYCQRQLKYFHCLISENIHDHFPVRWIILLLSLLKFHYIWTPTRWSMQKADVRFLSAFLFSSKCLLSTQVITTINQIWIHIEKGTVLLFYVDFFGLVKSHYYSYCYLPLN